MENSNTKANNKNSSQRKEKKLISDLYEYDPLDTSQVWLVGTSPFTPSYKIKKSRQGLKAEDAILEVREKKKALTEEEERRQTLIEKLMNQGETKVLTRVGLTAEVLKDGTQFVKLYKNGLFALNALNGKNAPNSKSAIRVFQLILFALFELPSVDNDIVSITKQTIKLFNEENKMRFGQIENATLPPDIITIKDIEKGMDACLMAGLLVRNTDDPERLKTFDGIYTINSNMLFNGKKVENGKDYLQRRKEKERAERDALEKGEQALKLASDKNKEVSGGTETSDDLEIDFNDVDFNDDES